MIWEGSVLDADEVKCSLQFIVVVVDQLFLKLLPYKH